MDMSQIKALAQLLNDADLSALEISEGENKIRLEKNAPAAKTADPCKSRTEGQGSAFRGDTDDLPAGVDFNNMQEIRSPMVGVFYRAPSEDAEPFVKIGDKVKKGDVLCIIEAMKLMNEICAESDGEIVDICAQSGQVVEYGQTIFKIF